MPTTTAPPRWHLEDHAYAVSADMTLDEIHAYLRREWPDWSWTEDIVFLLDPAAPLPDAANTFLRQIGLTVHPVED